MAAAQAVATGHDGEGVDQSSMIQWLKDNRLDKEQKFVDYFKRIEITAEDLITYDADDIEYVHICWVYGHDIILQPQ